MNTTCGTNCSAYSSSAEVSSCVTQDQTCLPTQTKTGPDGDSYRLDTCID